MGDGLCRGLYNVHDSGGTIRKITMPSKKETRGSFRRLNGTGPHLTRVVIFCAIFLPLLTVGTLAGLVSALPDSTGLRNDALHIREKIRSFTRSRLPDDALRNEAVRLRLSAALYDNPEAYYRSSSIEQADNNMDKALTDMELALGLLELSPYDHARYAVYSRRRDGLKQMLSQQPDR